MSEKIQDVFKNLKVSRMIVLVVIISTLIYINAVLEAVAFSVASSSVAIILVASILIAEHRLKSL